MERQFLAGFLAGAVTASVLWALLDAAAVLALCRIWFGERWTPPAWATWRWWRDSRLIISIRPPRSRWLRAVWRRMGLSEEA